jgi:periplasmic divalent cation tolerance protein
MQAATEHACAIVTAPNITIARKIASAVLSARLAACANLVPKIESHYWWQGQLESSSEVLLFFKTLVAKLPELEACVLKNHTYQTPEFVVVKIDAGNENYLQWINESMEPPK